MTSVTKPVYTVQVRELVEFVLRRGGLGGSGDFAGPGRALAGTRGHQRVQSSRPAGYQKEISVFYEVEAPELTLRIQGRIDGLIITSDKIVLEEIKTVQSSWRGVADPLHWAQGKIYAAIYAHTHPCEKMIIRLVYLDLDTGALSEFDHQFSRAELASFFQETAAVYLEWIRERHRWRQERDRSIRALGFPFPRYRAGQRELAVAAYRTLVRGGRFFVEAATGIGKTVSVLFPALKAMAEGKLERIFYLTARTVGRTVAEKAFADLRQAGLLVRTLTLTAKEKVCVREGIRCDPNTCPLALGYYDRFKAAMRDALSRGGITRSVLEEVGRAHQVCPFELSLDVSLWIDAVICDYNYVFDPKVYLRRHFGEEARDYAFLVDEAHNLPDRAREMFSAELHGGEIQEVRRAIQKPLPRCAKTLGRLGLVLGKLCASKEAPEEAFQGGEPGEELDLFRTGHSTMSPPHSHGQKTAHQAELPTRLIPVLEDAMEETEIWLARNDPAEFRERLLELYFHLHAFRRTAEVYDEHFVTIVEPASRSVRLFCIDPSHLLRQALERGKAAVFFSATLTPIDYYRSLIGGSSEDPHLQLHSPFAPENLATLVHDRIRTQWKARADTLAEVAQAIGTLVQGRQGNYLVYFPSYQYLSDVRERFHALYPSIQLLAQSPGMTEAQRDDFLAAFASEAGETLVGFAVMGGIFGEGIDLVGERLIGAVIVGVGLPQLCVERDLISDYFQIKTGAGFDYAYTFPGMNRVLQATGRVIRSETDRGVVLLIDTRFAEQRYRRLFPGWWQSERVRSVSDIQEAVSRFWQGPG